MRHGYELNYPLLAQTTDSHAGDGAVSSFLTLDSDRVVLTALKKAEDSDELIVRFYEFAGTKGDVRIEFARPITAAWETNLQEKPERQLKVEGKVVTVPTGAYEIKTVKLQFAVVSP